MNLQPSISYQYNDRRLLFAQELTFGGHGQMNLDGAGTYTPPGNYVFYRLDFLSDSTVSSVVFRTVNEEGQTIYEADNADFVNVAFPSGYSWNAPLTSVTLASGTAIAYMYRQFDVDSLACSPGCGF